MNSPVDPKTVDRFPIGASISLEQLAGQPYEVFAALREHEPVSWLPALNGWFVTSRDLGVQVMRDDVGFTVDDPRFTTQVVLGPSMLSVDGDEHDRHRSPFAPAFRPAVIRAQFDDFLADECRRLLNVEAARRQVELRTGLAGPLAVAAITKFLGLVDVTTDEVLSWYTNIADAIVALTVGDEISDTDENAIRELRRRVDITLEKGADDSLLRKVAALGVLRPDEMTSAAAVLMFGAIETSEGMTANALWHLLSRPELVERVRADRSLVPAVVEESLRLEPAAAFIDRYTTRDIDLGSVRIAKGDLVTVSLLAANRDPALFEHPDDFRIDGDNLRQHVTFVQGPHGCLGLHLARLETVVAINAVLDTTLRLDPDRSVAPRGLIFRKPNALWATRSING